MFFLFQLTLVSVLLDYSTPELTVHVGDSVLMECVFQNMEEEHVTKVDWMFSSKKDAKDEYVLYYYANLSVPVGRFQNRACLVGDISRSDCSLLIQDVNEADQGTYTCAIRFLRKSLVFKREVVLHVIPEEPKELSVQVGDSAQMRCAFQSTQEKHMTKLDWEFSSGEHAKKEIVLQYYSKTKVSVDYSQNGGRFQNRVSLVGDISRNDGSIMLQEVKESDGGNYTCSIHLGNLEVKKTIVLQVILKEHGTLVTSVTLAPDILGGNQLVVIVGIICTTILLLAVLILIMKRTHRNKSSVNSTALVKNLENTKKANPEKHVYSSISTKEVTEEELTGQSEATYVIMHPVRPSVRSAQNKPLGKK